jgi:peptidyl-prolyl cis-trans isomerase D
MLSLFRARGLANVVYGVVIAATILVFVIQFRPNANQKTSATLKEACVATVRGWCIDPKDHRAAMLLLARSADGRDLSPAQLKRLKIKKLALDGLIERELLVGDADRLGITATEQEVTDQLFDGFVRASIPADDDPAATGQLPIGREAVKRLNFDDTKTGNFDSKVYERRIRAETGMSSQQFREEQTRELVASKMRDLIRAPIRVSDAEAFDDYLREFNTATVNYVDVKEAWVSKYVLTATDAEIAAWLKDHQADVDKEFDSRKEGLLPKEGRVRHILAAFAHRGAPTDDDKAKSLARISEAWRRLKSGEPFAVVASEMTEDPGSKSKGGGYDSMDGFDPFFKRSADALKPGETTNGAIETQFGYHILEKDDPAKSADLEASIKKAIARELFLKSKLADGQKEIAGRLILLMKSGKSADDAVKETISPYVKSATIEPARIIEDDAKPAADADAGTTATDAAPADAPKKAAPKGPGAPVAAPAADTDADAPKVETSNPFSAGGDPIAGLIPGGMAQVIKFAFHAKDGDVMDDPAGGMDGIYVVALKERHTVTRPDFDKDREVQLAKLLTQKQNEALGLYVARLKEEFKNEIKVDDSYFAEPDGGARAASGDDDEGY